jgi:hypothetical protein
MTYSDSEIKLYVDTMVVQALLSDDVLLKNAQSGSMISDLISKVKSYFTNQVDPNDKVASIFNMLSPGIISTTLSALGLPWLGIFLGLATRVFHVDVAGIFRTVWTKLKEMVGSGKQLTSAHVDGTVDDAVQSHNKPATEEEANQAAQQLKTNDTQHAKSASIRVREAKMFKLAMKEYQANPGLLKQAGVLDWFTSKKSSAGSLFGEILKWIFKIGLSAAGLMVAGDIINKFLDRPNALDGSMMHGKPTGEAAQTVPQVTSKQTKFKVNPGYTDTAHSGGGWIENVTNSKESIGDLILRWTNEVYPSTRGLDSIIRNTAGFQTIVETIAFQNNRAAGGPVIFIPRVFSSKKMIVDHFIDEVAEKAP